jgi:hypothetical protein
MKIKNILLVLLCYVVIYSATAQSIDIEKTHEVSKAAMKGFVHKINVDEAKKQIEVIYRVRSGKHDMKFIIYTFDLDFNFINQTEEVYDIAKIPTRFTFKRYRGENYEVEGLYIQPNILGSLILKRKVTKFNWSWFNGRYNITTSVEGKLKAKTEDDKTLFYYNHVEDVNSGTALILASEKGKMKEDPFRMSMKFHFLKYDINLTKLADIPVFFPTIQSVIGVQGFPTTEDDPKSDMIVIFAPTKTRGGPDEIYSKSATEFTYVRVSYEGKLIDKITFNSPNSIWRIDDFVIGSDGAVYFFGPSNNKTEFETVNDIGNEKKKWPNFQLAKVKNGKVEFISSTNMDEFESKLKPQPDGKKGDPYNGRRMLVSELVVGPTNEVILGGQNWSNGKTGREYEDLVTFHFDANGKLVSQYTMRKKDKGTAPDNQFYEFSSDGKNLFWTYFDNVGTKTVKELEATIEKPLGVPKMGKINLANGTFDKYTEYGKGENFVHYGGVLNYLKFTDVNKVNYLGENKKGSSLWFVKVNLDK